MAIYGATNCDEAGSFTSIVTNGDGVAGFDNVDEQEGVACFYTDMGGIAGYAYSVLALDTDIGDGDYFHIGGHLFHNRDYDFSVPGRAAPILDSPMVAIGLYSSGASKSIRFYTRNDLGGSGYANWTLWSNALGAGEDKVTFDPSWGPGFWRYPHIYGYIHETEGWLQVREGGVTLAEITGIDTYPGSDWDRLVLGPTYEAHAVNEIFYAFDDFIVDDEASPIPPGSGDGHPLCRGIISPWYNNQRNCRGAVGLVDVS